MTPKQRAYYKGTLTFACRRLRRGLRDLGKEVEKEFAIKRFLDRIVELLNKLSRSGGGQIGTTSRLCRDCRCNTHTKDLSQDDIEKLVRSQKPGSELRKTLERFFDLDEGKGL